MKIPGLLPALLILTASLTVGCKSEDKAGSKDSEEPKPATENTPKADPAPTKAPEATSKPDPKGEPAPAKTLVALKKDTRFKTDVELVVPAGFEGFVTPHEGGEADPAAYHFA